MQELGGKGSTQRMAPFSASGRDVDTVKGGTCRIEPSSLHSCTLSSISGFRRSFGLLTVPSLQVESGRIDARGLSSEVRLFHDTLQLPQFALLRARAKDQAARNENSSMHLHLEPATLKGVKGEKG